jgi:hypothetical protein
LKNVLYFNSTGGSPFYSFRDVFGMSIPKLRGKNQYLHFAFRCVMHCLDWFGLVFMGYDFSPTHKNLHFTLLMDVNNDIGQLIIVEIQFVVYSNRSRQQSEMD